MKRETLESVCTPRTGVGSRFRLGDHVCPHTSRRRPALLHRNESMHGRPYRRILGTERWSSGLWLPHRTTRTNDGRRQDITVQRFERNRLELHPENKRPYDVLLGATYVH